MAGSWFLTQVPDVADRMMHTLETKPPLHTEQIPHTLYLDATLARRPHASPDDQRMATESPESSRPPGWSRNGASEASQLAR